MAFGSRRRSLLVDSMLDKIDSLLGLNSPEGRIHTLRAPILQTRMAETRDEVSAQIFGINLFTPKQITCDLAKGPGCKKGGR